MISEADKVRAESLLVAIWGRLLFIKDRVGVVMSPGDLYLLRAYDQGARLYLRDGTPAMWQVFGVDIYLSHEMGRGQFSFMGPIREVE